MILKANRTFHHEKLFPPFFHGAEIRKIYADVFSIFRRKVSSQPKKTNSKWFKSGKSTTNLHDIDFLPSAKNGWKITVHKLQVLLRFAKFPSTMNRALWSSLKLMSLKRSFWFTDVYNALWFSCSCTNSPNGHWSNMENSSETIRQILVFRKISTAIFRRHFSLRIISKTLSQLSFLTSNFQRNSST